VQLLVDVATASLVLLAESLVLTGIVGLLLVIEPLGAMAAVSVFGLADWGFQQASWNRTSAVSKI
jgi:hypothetical protein